MGNDGLFEVPVDFNERVLAAAKAWRLTGRQTDVLRLVVLGRPNKIVAYELECSIGTVELHATQLYRKASVGGRAELVAKFWTTRFDEVA